MDTKKTVKLSATERSSLIKKYRSGRIKKKSNAIEITDEKVIETFVEQLQIDCQKHINAIKSDKDLEDVKYASLAMIEAEEVWMNVQALIKSDMYTKLTDMQRVELIDKDFKDFYKNFPIVSRYMICSNQYSRGAFKKMLLKRDKLNKENEEKKSKGIASDGKTNEQLWIETQADYVRYLWEDVQKGTNFSQDDSDKIWQQIFDGLTKEFEDFRRMHDKAERKIEQNKIKHKTELLYEMSNRLISGAQQLSADDSTALLKKLQDKLYAQRYKKTLKQLAELPVIVEMSRFTLESTGVNDIAKDEYDHDIQQSEYKKSYKQMDVNKILA